MAPQTTIQAPPDQFRSPHRIHGREEVIDPGVDPFHAFSFGSFRVVPRARLLEQDGFLIPLGGRAFDLLCILASRAGEVVSKNELMAKTWPNVAVEETSLRFHISQLRRALGDNRGGERYVINVAGRGYCFVARLND